MLSSRSLYKILFIVLLTAVLVYLLRGDGVIRGSDSYTYMGLFDRIDDYHSIGSIYYMNDYFFSSLSFIIKYITNNPIAYLAILFFLSTAILFSAYFLFFMRYQSAYFYLGILLLLSTSTYYLFNVNALRQGLASSLVLLSLAILFNNRRHFASLLLIILATLTHKAALIALLISYLTKSERLNIKNSLLVFYFAVLTGFFIDSFILKLAYFFDLNYFVYKLEGLSKGVTGNTSVVTKLIYLVVVLTYFHTLVRVMHKDKLYLFLLNYYTYYASIVVIFFGFESMFNRLLMFTNLIDPILFVLTIKGFKQKDIWFITIILISILYMFFIFSYPSIQQELKI